MLQNEYTCEIITPLVAKGADKSILELRASALKGVMRFWWRALHGHLSFEELRKREGELFGESGMSQSPLTVRVWSIFPSGETYLLPHKKQVRTRSYKCGQSFKVVLKARKHLELYDRLFKIVVLLGGWGMRSRRGFGSITIRKINGNPYALPSDLLGIKCLLDDFYDKSGIARPMIDVRESAIVVSSNRDNRFPYIKMIEVGDVWTNADSLLQRIAQSASDHNHEHKRIAKSGRRFASPIVVSVIEDHSCQVNRSGRLRPIITTLNSVPPFSLKGEVDQFQAFKEAILT